MQSVVRLRSAVCLLGRFPALAGVDLDVFEGEVVLLSGGNGAGKTTLLRLLAGLVPLHSGTAEVLGQDLDVDRRAHRRMIGLVGHESACYDDLTIGENLRFAARAAAVDDPDERGVLDQLGLTPLVDTVHRKLSAGQRRRLALAIALVRRPRLLLLDEPHAGLDAEGRAALDRVLEGTASSDRAVVLASHELERMRPLVSREVVLTAGQAHGVAPRPPDAAGPSQARPLDLSERAS
ncbi:MAG TPA: heme ABC exporter ATP-binding protein CcmA [Acidimicrobiales bacterium]